MKFRWLVSVCCVMSLAGCMSGQQGQVVQETASIGAMQVIGQAEFVTIQPQGLKYRARIDSGATTCSMSALDIEQFERDGKKWVRFRLPLPADEGEELKKSDVLEYPISRIASIKRHGAEDQIRPAVMLQSELGDFKGRVEFTLTDRTKYEFPVLVGRNLLEGNALIDVSQSYIAEEQ